MPWDGRYSLTQNASQTDERLIPAGPEACSSSSKGRLSTPAQTSAHEASQVPGRQGQRSRRFKLLFCDISGVMQQIAGHQRIVCAGVVRSSRRVAGVCVQCSTISGA
jgi:hypothetical protein